MKEVHIVKFSGGKDSTAMLLKMLDNNMQIDEIIFNDTGAEFPEIYEHIREVEGYIKRKITRLKASSSFEYYMLEHEKTTGKRKGTLGYGWPDFRNRWCTTILKIQPTRRYLRNKYSGCKIVEYIGIAIDEPKRVKADFRYPLIEFNMTERDALLYCYERGFNWSGLYSKFNRVSCYLCPLQRLSELKVIHDEFPELWEYMKNLDQRSIGMFGRKFRADYSIEELERKFKKCQKLL